MDLPEDSEDYQIMRQWGTPNIFVTLILYILVRVRGGRMRSGRGRRKDVGGRGRESEREGSGREGEEVVGGRRSGMERTKKRRVAKGVIERKG